MGSDALMQIADQDVLPDLEDVQKSLRPALLKTFPAALLGRMIITPYYPLTDDVLRTLIKMRLGKIADRARDSYGAEMVYGDEIINLILDRCEERESGGRVIDAILTNTVLPKLSSTFLGAKLEEKNIDKVFLSVEDKNIVYSFE